MDSELLLKAFAAYQKGQSYAFATIIEATPKGTPRKSGSKMIVLKDGSLFGTIGGGRNEKAAIDECLKAIKTGNPHLVQYDYFGEKGQSVCGGQIKVFIEPFVHSKHLIICGAGHIALPLSFLAKMLHFRVTIIDDRPEFAHKSRFPHVDSIQAGKYSQELTKNRINSDTYIMIVTRGNELDYECLHNTIKTKAGYIGVISSKAKRIKFFKRLLTEGIKEKSLKKISIPAGVDIGAQTPEEIAISIMAEIISQKNRHSLHSDKFLEKTKELE